MRVDSYIRDVVVTPMVEFTRSEVALMVECSSKHYDATCRLASLPGPEGVLNGINNRFAQAEETVRVDLTTRELDLLVKILEPWHPGLESVDLLYKGLQEALRATMAERARLSHQLARGAEKTPPVGRCPSIHNRWRCSEPAVGPHVHALRDSDGRPIAVWLDDGRLLLTPEQPGEDDALAAADEQDRMIALALLDNAHTIAQCTIDALAEGGGEGAKNAALLAVELLHALCCMIAELPEDEAEGVTCESPS